MRLHQWSFGNQCQQPGNLCFRLNFCINLCGPCEQITSYIGFGQNHAMQLGSYACMQFSASISQGTVPSDWKLANVVPIFKKGSKSCPLNYRPVSLTSICCKILGHIIYSSICHRLEDHNIICNEQLGFCSGRSYETQLLITIYDLAQNLNNRK